MEVALDETLLAEVPNAKFGIIHYENITIGHSPQMLKGRLQLFQESLFFELENKNISEIPEIKEWRSVFKRLGKDPNRYRHSAEALYRRVKKQKYMPSINSATDINNFFSLKYRIPLGIYDKDLIKGNVMIRKGRIEESYLGLNGRENSVENLPVAADDAGPFGSPFVDSMRTAVTPAAKNAVQIVYLPLSIEKEEAEKLVESLASMFTHINGGNSRFSILSN
ncbi:B3/4 domain-containing protein [Siminovitchia sp. 179-K 8D1 HS]|uniref:B3/B4 domain-containing protein n=1 Tax=Siminovitchia sp. 179-K 8D1 HS TaxID=3142385 RepID=UPI0039A00F4A